MINTIPTQTDRHTTNTYMISSKMTTTTTSGIQSRRAGTRSSFVSNATHLLLLLLLLAFFSLVSSTPSDSLNRYVENYMSRRHIPSIAALRITDRGNSTRSC
jgi:D-alanyl-lipoteichoic acid acyltransferase DltB (MBOAT superfamily)